MPDDRGSDTTTLLLDACQKEMSSQDAQNREFSVKAAACLVLGLTFLSEESLYHKFSLVLLSLLTIFSMLILIPWFWQRPFDIRAVIAYVNRTKISSDQLASDMTEGYSKAITRNWKILDSKSICLQVLYAITLVFIGWTLFQSYPDFFDASRELLQD